MKKCEIVDIEGEVLLTYRGVDHKPGAPFSGAPFEFDVNLITFARWIHDLELAKKSTEFVMAVQALKDVENRWLDSPGEDSFIEFVTEQVCAFCAVPEFAARFKAVWGNDG